MHRLILCAALLVPMAGCDREVSSEKEVEVKDNGTVVTEEKKVTEKADGTAEQKETKSVDK
jgi:hypothetical protein